MFVTKIAWLGHVNFGDDVMAEAMTACLVSKSQDYQETIWCEGHVQRTDISRSIYLWDRLPAIFKPIAIRWHLRRSDAMIIGGGSILHSLNSVRWKKQGVEYFKSRNPNGKAIGIGLSLGPFANAEAEEECKALFDLLDAVSLRDEASIKQARSWQPKCKIIEASDLAGLYVSQPENLVNEVDSRAGNIKRVGVSLVEKEVTAAQRGDYLALIKSLAQSHEEVVLFSFCGSQVFGDYRLLEALREESGASNVSVQVYDGDTLRFAKALASCDFMVGQRLHSIILSYLLRVPFLSLNYHKKCQDFFALTGISDEFLLSSEGFDPVSVISRVRCYEFDDVKRDSFIQKSLANIEVLDELF